MRYIGIIILLVLCLTLLLLTGCIVNTVIAETAVENMKNQEDINQNGNNFQSSSAGSVQEPTEEPETENPQKWSGLGMGLFYLWESYVDTLLANGFTELRIDIPDYENTYWLASSKVALPGIIAKSAKVIWGVSCGWVNTITAANNWGAFRLACLDAAQWSKDNGVYEFQLGNEAEDHNDDTTLTDAQLIANLKSLSTEVQAIFTNGNVSYSCYNNNIGDWVSAVFKYIESNYLYKIRDKLNLTAT